MLIVPFLAAGAIGYVLDSDYRYLFKIFLLALIALLFNGLVMVAFNER